MEEKVFGAANPYHIGEPVRDPAGFVGRREIISWVWQSLATNESLLLVVGAPLIGKSSLLLQLQREAPSRYLAVYMNVRETLAGQKDLMGSLIRLAHAQLLGESVENGLSVGAGAPSTVWRALREASAARRPLLLLDDLDRILEEDASWVLMDGLAELMRAHPDVQVIVAVRSLEKMRRVDRLAFSRAPFRRLEPFSRSEAVQLIKGPSEGRLEFDYEAVARIDELTGRHPYYIQLLCGTLFELNAGTAHVSIVDLEPALNVIGQQPVAPFESFWDSAFPEGRLVLALLGSMKGAYEVVTQAEIATALRAQGIVASGAELSMVVGELVSAGALVQLGPSSFRLPVELFRYWLRAQHPIGETVKVYAWRPFRRRLPKPASADGPAVDRQRKFTLAVAAPFAVFALAISLIAVLRPTYFAPVPTPSATPGLATRAALLIAPTDTPLVPTLTALALRSLQTPSPTMIPSLTFTPTPSSTPTETFTPTPTRPLVVAKSLPAIAFMRKEGNSPWRIWLMGADGSFPAALTDGEANDTSPIWSPDGSRIAFVSDRDGNREIYVMGAGGSVPVNITRHEADDWTPAWSPDGTEIAFSSMRDGNWEIYIMWSDGSDALRITSDPESDYAPTWSPDGKRIAFASKRDGDWDIYVMDRDGKNVRQLTNSPGSDVSPAWSPDGKYIAFESNRDGNTEIYRMRPDGKEQTNLTKSPRSNDHWPTWSPDGQRLAFYSNRDGSWHIYVMSADGENVVRLTRDGNNQAPSWRP